MAAFRFYIFFRKEGFGDEIAARRHFVRQLGCAISSSPRINLFVNPVEKTETGYRVKGMYWFREGDLKVEQKMIFTYSLLFRVVFERVKEENLNSIEKIIWTIPEARVVV